MTSMTHTIRHLTRALVLAIALAAFAAPEAFGDSPSDRPDRGASGSQAVAPDWFERAALRASQAQAPDWFERAAARAAIANGDRRSPDTIDAALAAQSGRTSVTRLDLRSPDTRDAALRAHPQVTATESGHAFDWGAFGFGIVASLGILLLVGAGTITVRGPLGGRIRST